MHYAFTHNIHKTENERMTYGDELKEEFSELSSGKNDDIWEKIRQKLVGYATNDSGDEGLKEHVTSQADYLFNHMQNVWKMVLDMAE